MNPFDPNDGNESRLAMGPAVLAGSLALALAHTSTHAQAMQEEALQERMITLQRVEVTGSHIRRAGFETAQPLLVLDRNALSRTGLDSVGDILQQLPQHVSDLNSDYNNGGNGEVRVDLRNLGAQRTLVLLNGHRYVNAVDGAVDVGSIPLPVVERIEVLTDGASAIYGSDAIAGVVNVITRDAYDGLETNLYYAINEHGDGARRAADVTWGRNGPRGNVVLNLSFADQQPIWAGDRTISAVPAYGLPADDTFAGASGNTPQGRIGFGEGGSAPCGEDGGWLTWDAAGRFHRCFDERSDGYNFAPENYLRTPYERLALFAQARYKLTPRTALRTELLLHRRESSQQLAPTPIRQFDTGEDPNHHAIAADSLYNPFGEPVTFYVFRPLVRARRFEQDVTTHYLSLGLEGTFDAGARSLAWDLNLIDSRMHNDQSITGGYDLHRLGLGVGPSLRDASGTARCGTVQAPLADCVPLDFLHGVDGFDSAMYGFIAVDGHYEEERRLRDVLFGLSGEVLDLPAGPLTFAAGAEYRDERGSVRPGPLLADDAFDFGGFAPDPVDGRTRVREVYAEVAVPLIARRAWTQALDLELAVRHSDYSDFGGTTNGKIGVAWRPRDDWLVRGTWSQGYRAPSASELFGSSNAFQPTVPTLVRYDPCLDDPQGIVAERCAADGVPVGDFHPPVGPVVISGSNPDLQPEQARNRSLGVVWSPSMLPGLDVSLDWWRIELGRTIDDIPDTELPRMCYRQGIEGACRQLRRDPATGTLTHVDARLFNYGTTELEGYDLTLDLRWQGRWGDFQLHWFTVYLSRYLREIPEGAPPVSLVGNYFFWDPGWRLRSLLSLDWNAGDVGATVRLRYYPSLDEECFWPASSERLELCDRPDFQSPTFAGQPEHVIDARTYVDLQFRWQPRTGTQLSIGVDNAFDLDPALSYNSPNSYDPSYDIPGRFWYASWRQHF